LLSYFHQVGESDQSKICDFILISDFASHCFECFLYYDRKHEARSLFSAISELRQSPADPAATIAAALSHFFDF
jgi:hypothetical protein